MLKLECETVNGKKAMSYDNARSAIQAVYAKAEQLSKDSEAALKAHPAFPHNHVFDEDKSVRWNREERERRAAARKQVENEYRQKETDCWQEAVNAIQTFILDEYDFSEKIAELVYEWAYHKGHAYGYLEVLCEAQIIGEQVRKLIDTYEKERSKK